MGYDHRVKVLIQIHFEVNGSKVLRRGDISVNSFEYKIKPDNAAAESAIRYIKDLRREHPGMKVYKVVYKTIDITELVLKELKRIDDEILNDTYDVPF
ncbi:MAG TPA: hypothetical protein VEY70_14165 [Metabacillus sp.]|nr:hypothetical protein [Metabacillus sp.]